MFSRSFQSSDIGKPGDPFYKQKKKLAKKVLRHLRRYIESELAFQMVGCVFRYAFEVTSEEKRSVTTSESVGQMYGFFPLLPIPLSSGNSSTSRTITETISKYTYLKLNLKELIDMENTIARRLKLDLEQKWVYPFAVFKLILISQKKEHPGWKRATPRDSVLWWTHIQQPGDNSDQIPIETMVRVAECRYGPLGEIPG